MLATWKRLGIVSFCVVVAVCFVLPGETPVKASNPGGASYCTDSTRTFWFIHASDTHIGASGTADTTNLKWLVTTARTTIKPLFTVVTGDLTDSTNANFFGIPNGPYQVEWDSYKSTLASAGITRDNPQDYYDLPGNHDAYNDRYFTYYKNNAIRGGVYASAGQVAWTKELEFGKYHFVGVNTAGNTGASFSLTSPFGDPAGLDGTELQALGTDLGMNVTANLTFVFGHHPVSSTGDSGDTYLYYGAPEFVGLLDTNYAVSYDHGHVHDNVETFFTGNTYTGGTISPGFRYSRVDSLGKDASYGYRVVSVDCDGVNAVFQPYNTWPVVLVTAPVNRSLGGVVNQFAYSVTAASNNFVRALVFDTKTPTVSFRVDSGATYYPMTAVSGTGPQFVGAWDASQLSEGEHTIEVRAVGTTTRSHSIKVWVTSAGNRAPVALNDSYSTPYNKALVVAAPGVLANDSDPDGNPLTSVVVSPPTQGSLTLNANGSFTYTPTASGAGTDSFTYTAGDGSATSAPATVTINLTPLTDTVSITTATYTSKTKTLLVRATSSNAPTAVLTVTGYGQMTYSSGVYTLQKRVSTRPASVTVTSSSGGSATLAVTVR